MTGTIIDLAQRRNSVAMPQSVPTRNNFEPRYNAHVGPDGEAMKPTKERWWNFQRAEFYWRFVEAQTKAEWFGGMLYDRYALPEFSAFREDDRSAAHFARVERQRAAAVMLLMTPVSRRAELDLKKSVLNANGGWWAQRIDADRAAIERVMAADEAYIKIPRQHRNRALSGKAVRS